MNGLSIQNIHKAFAGKVALAGVSFQVAKSEIVALLGPSGCGKSTLLAIIAGLEKPDQGDVEWDGASLAQVPPHRRGFGLMFQDFALFPHRNVFENVAFGLRMAGMDERRIQERVQETLELVGLPGFGERDVNTLSGGEAQRVALARSLAPEPRLLMLDEPLGSLDRGLRERLALELRHILRDSRQTAIYVTHDQEEAFVIADRVVVMNAGRVEQIGAPQEIYRKPGSVFVARFLGLNNLIPGEVTLSSTTGSLARTAIGDFPAPDDTQGKVTLLLRPDAARLDAGAPIQLQGVLKEVSFRGGIIQATLAVNGVALQFQFAATVSLPEPGSLLSLGFEPAEAIQIFPPQN
jgi:ABC-type Fe3+/spermidine/putrescine transport system ATPase subunit